MRDTASFLAQAVARALAYGRERRERERAEQALQAHDRFVTMLSHELRNPLIVILGYAHLANKSDIGRERREHRLGVVERNAAFLSRLVNDLLDVSRLPAQKIALELTTFDVAALTVDVVGTMRAEAERKRLELTLTGAPHAILIEADVTGLQQALVNVLSNAVKFTPSGGAIHVTFQHTPSSVEITVADSGQGIKADILPHIFEAYRQGATADAQHQGLGLGLAIAKDLLLLHGGSIVAESAGEGHGATFRISLPRYPQQPLLDPTAAAVRTTRS
jgi:signal transduction histidine kinase